MAEEKRVQGDRGSPPCGTPQSKAGPGCPICSCLWPRATAGKVVVLVVLLAVAAVLLVRLLRPSVDDLMTRGMTLYDEKRYDEAARVFEDVLRRNPKRPLALDYLGLIALRSGDVDKAILYRKKAAEFDPLTPQHHWNLAHLYFYVKKDYVACEQELEKAMQLAPQAQYRLLYALCAVELRKPEDVIIRRLRDVIRVAEVQVYSLKPEQLTADGPFATWWKEAAKRLGDRGDRYGYERLRQLSVVSAKPEVREFARGLIDGMEQGPPTR